MRDVWGNDVPANPGPRALILPNGRTMPIRHFLRIIHGCTIYDNPTGDETILEFDGGTMATEVTIVQLPQGQQNAAASAPVVIASDQVLPLPTGAATQATLAALAAQHPATLGQKAMSASLAVTLASDQSAIAVASSPSSAVGASTHHHAISAASTNATSVKGSAGTINDMTVCNNATSKRYFKLYNKATAPTVGTDVPVLTMMIPPGETQHFPCGAYGLRLATGIAYATTTGITVADSAAVGLNDLAIHLGYT